MDIIESEYDYERGGIHMDIRPSAAIRQNYNEISELCKKNG